MDENSVDPELLHLAAKFAWLYHEEGFNQPEIAKKFGVPQGKVSRLLKLAEDEGVVRTTVNLPVGMDVELERRLEEKFGLMEAVIAPNLTGDSDVSRILGSAAARYLESSIEAGEVIGISSWSSTLVAMSRYFTPSRRVKADKIVQLLGGVGTPRAQILATQMASRLSSLLGGELVLIQAPGVVSTSEAREALLGEPAYEAVATAWNLITTALIGIGTTDPSPLLRDSGNFFTESKLNKLSEAGAVGDVCLHYFNNQGELVDEPNGGVVMGISPEQLRKVPRRVGIAAGAEKVDAIRGALQGGWVNVLLTDRETAHSLLS